MNENIQSLPTFSIIVPVYNSGTFLEACIESIISQSYSNWELILVNDGSSDNSPRICDSYALIDARIKVFHNNNNGVSVTRNIGLDIACGKYICFIDSDDVIDSFLLEKVLPFTEKQIDCIVYGYDRIHNGKLEQFVLPNRESGNVETKNIESFIWELKYYNLFVPLWNKIYKSSIIEKYNLRNENDITINEDLIFNQRFFHKIKTLSYINIPLYHYTLYSTNNCLSKRICDPETLLHISNIIKETSFQDSDCRKLYLFDKFYYWDFLRLSYINSFLIAKYSRRNRLTLIDLFISKIKHDSDYKEYLISLGRVKRFIYSWKSKYIIYMYHILYNWIKNISPNKKV